MESVKNEVHFSLFKGEPGTRKSTQALSYPKPQYWISTDHKMNALLLPMKKWNVDAKQIQFEDYTDWNPIIKKLESFQINCPFKTIIDDSITSNGDIILRQVRKSKGGTTRKSGQQAGKMIGGIEVNEVEDYNAESAGFNEFIALLKDIHKTHRVDIILIAHVIRVEERVLGGATTIARSIVTAAKKVAAKIPAYCDETYHFNVETDIDISKGGKYSVITSNVGDDFARTTLQLPPKIELAEGDNLYEKWIKPAIDNQRGK